MTKSHVSQELLHRYFDAELGDDAASEVAEHVGGCDECAQLLARLDTLRHGVRARSDEMASEVDFDALFGRIEAALKAAAADAEPAHSTPVRIGTAPQRKRRGAIRFLAPATGLLAAAAALIVLRDGFDVSPHADANPNTEIEQVAFNDDYGGTVFQVPLSDGVSTNVVWINDYDDDDADDETIQ